MDSPAGRYAPSPSGDLHAGNLRTAAIAWLCARASGRRFLLRVEDIDSGRSRTEFARRQLEDLAAIGLDWDGEVIYQHRRLPRYEEVLDELTQRGLIYECYCSRRDIQEATSAPHATPGIYPGTCRELDDATRQHLRDRLSAEKRVPALRIRTDISELTVHDVIHGDFTGDVDDFVVRRGGNINQGQDFAYNFVVVIDDGDSGVDQVVRGEDLLSSTPRQAWLQQLLGYPRPEYIHVPLVTNQQGQRLAKRDGAVTLREMDSTAAFISRLCALLGYPEASSLEEVLGRFRIEDLKSLSAAVWD